MAKEKRNATIAWLERSNPLRGLTIAQANMIFDCARNGDTQRLHWIFNEIESVNPVLLVCVERRASAVANFQWRVAERASQDGSLSAEQKDAVENFLGNIEKVDVLALAEQYPEEFNRDYDAECGMVASARIVKG